MKKDDLISRERAVSLFSIYENLLTDAQRKITSSHLLYDLSLSEIAENEGISRAAASEAIKTSLAKMEEFDSKLHLLEKSKNLKSRIEQIESITDENKRLKEYERLGEDLSNGI